MQTSAYRKCRLWTKIILLLTLYIFAFWFEFLIRDVAFIAEQNTIEKISVMASGQTYNITTSNYYQFNSQYSSSGQTLDSLNQMCCLIDDYDDGPTYSESVYNNSFRWITFTVCGLLSVVGLLLVKMVQVHVLDEIKAWYQRQQGLGKFNLINFLILNLWWACLLASHFYFFNFIYYGHTEPCLRTGLLTQVTCLE